jgi:predicted dehydrogenase
MIGSGRIAQTYLACWKAMEDCELVGVCDTNPAVANAAAEAYGGKAYTSHRELLANAKPDAVIVCTPPTTHRAITCDALGAGAHVLCEKPIATRAPDLAAMIQEAEARNRRLMMASKFRYVDDIVAASSLLKAGILGKPVRFENTFASWLDVRQRWNSDPAVAGGGVLIDNGTHSVDISRFLLGPITEVMAYHGPRVQPIEVEDTSHVSFRSESGATGTIDLSWSIHKERDSFIDVYGTEGMMSIGWKRSRYRQNHTNAWVEFGTGYDKNKAFMAQLRNFVLYCQGAESPRITLKDAMASVLVVEAAYASASEKRWRPVVEG